MLTRYTFSLDESELDDGVNSWATEAEARSAAINEVDRIADEEGDDVCRSVWISEIRPRNNDENEIVSTKEIEISSRYIPYRSDRDEHCWAGRFI